MTPAIEALAQPIEHIFGRTVTTDRVVLDVRYADLHQPRVALGVHRATIFHILHHACIDAGVTFELGRDVVSADAGRLVMADGATMTFDLVIDATGARSNIARNHATSRGERRRELAFGALWTTTPWPTDPHFDPRALQQVYRGASRMVGILPVGSMPGSSKPLATFFWSLKTDDYGRWRQAGLEVWKNEVLALWPETAGVLDAITSLDDLVLARYGHHTLRRPVGERLAIVGDAAHSTSPQLGQGVNMGLLDALTLSRALENHADLNDALTAYASARRGHMRLYQALSLGFTPFYQSDGRFRPWVRDHVLGKVARLPFAPRLLAATVSGLLLDPRPSLSR